MLFNSFVFIFVFLPLVILLFFAANYLGKYNTALALLLGMCFWFYGFFNPSYLLILVVSLIINYLLGATIQIDRMKPYARILLTVGIVANLGVLFVYKYLDFFLGNINIWFKQELPMFHILLPLGISFFTFQQISYLIDISKGEIKGYYTGIRGFVQYAVYVSFFPQLVAGPIVLHSELMPQLVDETRKKISFINLNEGLYIFVRGLAKKVLLADSFARIADGGYMVVGELNTLSAAAVMLAYTLQIYFDFGGYSDMAIGLARLLNIDIPVNFNSPYKAVSISDFWKRWHITLTRFFTIYLYFPMGGNRKGIARTCLNIFVVFLLSGLWHGANWTFVIWGVMHGVAQVIYRLLHEKMKWMPRALGWLVTFLFVNLAWVIFRADSVSSAIKFYSGLFAFEGWEIHPVILETFSSIPEVVFVSFLLPMISLSFWVVVFIGLGIIAVVFMKNTIEKVKEYNGQWHKTMITIVLAVWCVCSLSGGSTFLYFNF